MYFSKSKVRSFPSYEGSVVLYARHCSVRSEMNRLNAWPTGSGTIRRHGLVGVGMALLEKVYHCGGLI